MSAIANRCRVCGLDNDEPPWGADGTLPDFTFCPCCHVEAGYGDATPQGARAWRAAWIAAGAQWLEPSKRPSGWNLDEQLTQVPASFR